VEVDKNDKFKVLVIFPFPFCDFNILIRRERFIGNLRKLLIFDKFSKKLFTIVGLGFGLRIERHMEFRN